MTARSGATRRVRVLGAFVSAVGLGLLVVGLLGPLPDAQAQLRSASASDPRARFVSGNATTCAAVGFGSDVQVGSGATVTATGDTNVFGTVTINSGTIHPGEGQELNVTIAPGANVVIDAVVVKGGPAYNVYSNAAVLPPALGSPQHYISPFNGGGNVPAISHWFVCYSIRTPPPTGTFALTKVVIPPNGIPVDPLPTSYSALVNCNDGIAPHTDVTVTFGAGGGVGTPALTTVAAGTVCVVTEQNTGSLPPGTVVSYDPVGANTTGVTIPVGGSATVEITNDMSATAVQDGTLEVAKTVVAPPGVEVPATFNAEVVCDDGTSATITLPGTGGTGTPVVTATAGSLCNVEETTPLPEGWVTTYSVGGGPPTSVSPTVIILSGEMISIMITNDGTNATTTSTSTSTTTSTTTTTTTTTSTTTTVPETATTIPETTTTIPETTTTTTIPETTTTTVPVTTTSSTTTTTVPETTTTGLEATSTTAPTTTTTTVPETSTTSAETSTTTTTLPATATTIVGPESATSTTVTPSSGGGTATTSPVVSVGAKSGELPRTGGSSGPMTAGIILLVLGSGILAASTERRRRR